MNKQLFQGFTSLSDTGGSGAFSEKRTSRKINTQPKMKSLFCRSMFLAVAIAITGKISAQNTFPSSGNAGIGTLTPVKPLNLKGQSLFEAITTGDGGGRFFFDRPNSTSYENMLSFSTGGFASYKWLMGMDNDASDDFHVFGPGAVSMINIKGTTGFIGLGLNSTVTPLSRLHVNGSAVFAGSASATPASAAYIRGTNSLSTAALPDYTWYGDLTSGLFHPAASVMGFSVAGAEKMRIHSNGNIGISTTNPLQALHVSNNVLIDGFSSSLFFGEVAGTYAYGEYGIEYDKPVGLPGGLNFWKPFGAPSNGALMNYILYLNDNGKIGINTNNPTAQLTVNGKTLIGDPAVVNINTTGNYNLYVQNGILTEKVRVSVVNTAQWADYVFADNYKLRALSDVESFIKTNKHLPEVPSADDVLCNGVEMVEMDATLLKKVEELTLYIIEQNKRIESLETKLKDKQ
ncbi:MAG: hypothetical protein FD123_2886 [Bacteroidetes bacterium]|nr:MAG: hypothetical protein FD123_2886 [Bacteroidota bacterium]